MANCTQPVQPAYAAWLRASHSSGIHTCPLQTLKKHGYLYDSTLIERWYTWNPTSPSADAMLMPYTMDAGIPQVKGAGRGLRAWLCGFDCPHARPVAHLPAWAGTHLPA